MDIELAGSGITYKPNDDQLARVSLEFAAFDGEAGMGQIPIPSTTSAVATGRSAVINEGAVLVGDLRLIDHDRTKGPQPAGTSLEYGYSAADANILLTGFRVQRSRPVETDVARVLAMAAIDFPTWDTTWVINASTLSLPAKKFDSDGGWMGEFVTDLTEATGKTLFVHDKADGSGRCLHYHVLTTGHTSGLTISDVVADYLGSATTFNPFGMVRPTTSIDLKNDVLGRDPAGRTVLRTDPTSIGIHDADDLQHQALMDFDEGNLIAKTEAFLLSQKNDAVTYQCSIGPLGEDQLALIRVGDLIPVTSYPLGLTASTQRIAHMTLTVYIGDNGRARPGLWVAALELGAPIRRKARVKPGPRLAALVRPYIDVPFVPEIETEAAFAVIYSAEGNEHFGYGPLIVFGSTGDVPSGGLPTLPLTGGLEYVVLTNGFGTRQIGIRVTQPGTLTFHAKLSFLGVYGDTTVTIRMTIVKSGITQAFDEESGTFGFPALFAGVLEATATDIDVGIGDLIQVELAADGGALPNVPWGTGVGGEELRVSGITQTGEVVTPPMAGQPVPPEQVLASAVDGSTTDFTTNYPFTDGSLKVLVSGVRVIPTEVDGAAGTFTLPFAPAAGVPVILEYRAAGGDTTGAGNNPSPPSVQTFVTPDLLGSGSDGDGDLVLHDDGTWAPAEATSSFGLVPYYIPAGDTYRVPLYRQALFVDPIEVVGTLAVDGYLLEVD